MNDKYREEVSALERQLAELDLSDQSEIKDNLRHELILNNTAERRETPENNRFFRSWNMFRKPIPAMVLGIFLGVTILAFVHPDTRASIANIVKSFRVGDNTYIHQSGMLGETEFEAVLSEVDENLEQGKLVILQNEYGTWGGAVPKGEEPVIRQLSSLSITARLVDYSLQVPTYYHEKIPARSRFRKAQILPDGGTVITLLTFGIGPWETLLMHSPVSEGRSFTLSSGREPKIEEIEIGGKKVFWLIHGKVQRLQLGKWAEQHSDKVIGQFIWEHEGMSYLLNGKLLTKEEGIKIIESLRPVRVKK